MSYLIQDGVLLAVVNDADSVGGACWTIASPAGRGRPALVTRDEKWACDTPIADAVDIGSYNGKPVYIVAYREEIAL